MSECAPNLGDQIERFVKPSREIHTTFLHCSATSNPDFDVYACHRFHTDQNGWSCIGYHYYLNFDGIVRAGRDLERTPAAQSGYNTGTIAICLNGLHAADFTEDQFVMLRQLCEQINVAYGNSMRFRGHCEVAAKECPVFDYRGVLGLNQDGYMVGDAPLYEIPNENYALNISRVNVGANINSRHSDVYIAQGLLHAHGADPGPCDGIAGPKFSEAMKSFQRIHGLPQTGVAQLSDWEILEDAGN